VIVPAYNAAAFIRQTLDSVLNQTYRNIEVLVVDDGSADQTAEIVQSYKQKDARVQLFQQSNQGVAAARNLAIQKARGEYIAPIDADDIWYPEKLAKQVQCLVQADDSVGLVYAWSVHVDEGGFLTGAYIAWEIEGEAYLPLVYTNFVGNASVPLIRRACLEQVGDYSCQLRQQNAQGCEDRDLYLRIAEQYQFRVVPEFLIGYRQVIGSMACNYRAMEKSHQLVVTNIQKRYSTIPPMIYRWAMGNFYYYLGWRSNHCGMHWSTFIWLYKAFQWDVALLLRRQLYGLLIISCFQLIARPLTHLWQTHHPRPHTNRFQTQPRAITLPQIARKQSFRQRFARFSQHGRRLRFIQRLERSPAPGNFAALH
jgi:glycosyltransferase involved in cell wall biosynthesis